MDYAVLGELYPKETKRREQFEENWARISGKPMLILEREALLRQSLMHPNSALPMGPSSRHLPLSLPPPKKRSLSAVEIAGRRSIQSSNGSLRSKSSGRLDSPVTLEWFREYCRH
mmetsp:Transcript_84148/g.132880  ORF Transcript_84148/g.132880 Transcript_84148/m.132880 type:complete len:115 (-) Transcript_84148:53-397(-)